MRQLILSESEVNYLLTVLVKVGAIDSATGMAVSPENTVANRVVDFIVSRGTLDQNND